MGIKVVYWFGARNAPATIQNGSHILLCTVSVKIEHSHVVTIQNDGQPLHVWCDHPSEWRPIHSEWNFIPEGSNVVETVWWSLSKSISFLYLLFWVGNDFGNVQNSAGIWTLTTLLFALCWKCESVQNPEKWRTWWVHISPALLQKNATGIWTWKDSLVTYYRRYFSSGVFKSIGDTRFSVILTLNVSWF